MHSAEGTHSSRARRPQAAIKMIIKGRSPTMRHVSRTHRVAPDGLFGRVKFDPMIQIKYVDTKNQLADMLTKGSFIRDEWNHLLRLSNIMNFSMFSCSLFLSIEKADTMSKRTQERMTEEEPLVAKSRPACLVSRNLSAKQSPCMDSGASYSVENEELDQNSVFTSIGRPVRDRVQNPSASSQEWPGKPARNREPTCKDTVGPPQISEP